MMGIGFLHRRTAGAAAGAMLLAGLAACGEDPAVPSPASVVDGLSLEAFFAGQSYSKGTVTTALFFTEDFSARFEGKRKDGRLLLDEHFSFADGDRLQRWNLGETGPGLYTGEVQTELDGGALSPPVAVTGHITPNGAVLAYDGFAPGGGETRLQFRHRMTRQSDGTVANHVTVSKFGVPLATSDVVFVKDKAALDRD
ncbi:DUF3833 family protein [Aurantimonas sp. A2-1-M11]|uniref:DUF3833 family protein n=1 Tax=Aurantimonas sp. A2-1-M11 TaxID=3113712 RepID=UPI002F95BE25